jgi:hypothetical protein
MLIVTLAAIVTVGAGLPDLPDLMPDIMPDVVNDAKPAPVSPSAVTRQPDEREASGLFQQQSLPSQSPCPGGVCPTGGCPGGNCQTSPYQQPQLFRRGLWR